MSHRAIQYVAAGGGPCDRVPGRGSERKAKGSETARRPSRTIKELGCVEWQVPLLLYVVLGARF